jgi:acyl-CoA thioesterase FadM
MNHREGALIENYNMARQEGKSWVSISNQIAYLKPALVMEMVIIESQLLKFTTSNLLVEMRMYNHDKTQLKSVIWCGFVHYNLLKQKREIHSTYLMELFKSIHKPIDAKLFESRLSELKLFLVKN